MAANPRKFSEKIALHNQKQAAETVEFEKIMKEVKDATSKSALSNLEEVPSSRVETLGYHTRDRGRSIGPMRSGRPGGDKRIDTSPYSSGPYLSPPPSDTSWRRTNSDSALHQSSQENHHLAGTQRRVTDGQVNPHYSSHQSRRMGSMSPDRRPRSTYHVPGINIYPSHADPGIVQIPIGRNSGSLPDLSSFQFTSPLPTPLDADDTQHSSNPSYSNSPKGSTSPSTLSPTSIPSRSHPGRFSFGNSPPHESPGPPLTFSPVSPLSPNTPNHHNHHSYHHQNHNQLHLSVPNTSPMVSTLSNNMNHNHTPPQQQSPTHQPLVNRFQPAAKQGLLVESGSDSTYRSPHQHQSQFIYQVPSPQPPSPLSPVSSPQSIPNHVNNNGAGQNSLGPYRVASRPSPQSSPGLAVQQYSPLSVSPGSPDPAPAPPHNYNCFVEHFEQFTMGDSNASPNHHIDHIDYTQLGSLNNAYQPVHIKTEECNTELSGDPGYFSTSPSQQMRNTTSSNTTPNTPSSIPDIILTAPDFSESEDLVAKSAQLGYSKDLCMSGSFDTDFFPSDESLREGLDPIDLDGLQMLTDPELITDPSTEDHFRLDRL